MQGTVAYLTFEKNFAFIRSAGVRDHFLHPGELKNCSFADLKMGDVVEFESHDGPRGLRAVNAHVHGGESRGVMEND